LHGSALSRVQLLQRLTGTPGPISIDHHAFGAAVGDGTGSDRRVSVVAQTPGPFRAHPIDGTMVGDRRDPRPRAAAGAVELAARRQSSMNTS